MISDNVSVLQVIVALSRHADTMQKYLDAFCFDSQQPLVALCIGMHALRMIYILLRYVLVVSINVCVCMYVFGG